MDTAATLRPQLYGADHKRALGALVALATGCTMDRDEQIAAIRALDETGLDLTPGDADEAARDLFGFNGHAITLRGKPAVVIAGNPDRWVIRETWTGALLDMLAETERQCDDGIEVRR